MGQAVAVPAQNALQSVKTSSVSAVVKQPPTEQVTRRATAPEAAVIHALWADVVRDCGDPD